MPRKLSADAWDFVPGAAEHKLRPAAATAEHAPLGTVEGRRCGLWRVMDALCARRLAAPLLHR